MEEIWKDVTGYEGLYQVSNLGRVKSLDRYKKGNNCTYLQKGKILKLIPDKDNYHTVILYKTGTHKSFKIHRLVAETFILNPNNKEQVNHIDGNKQNNTVANLEWCDCIENVRYAFKNNLIPKRSGKSIEQYSLEGIFLKKWNSIAQAVLELNLPKKAGSGISNCCQHKKPTSYGFIWEYADDVTYRNYV